MKSRGPEHRVPWLALTAGALSWLLSSAPADLQGRCALTSAAWLTEPWRLWTGHLVHYGAPHLRGDLLAFVVWASLVEQRERRTLGLILFLAAPLLSLAILLSRPGLAEYRGLSGLDCSLVVALIAQRGLVTQRFRGLAAACLAAFALKCAYEMTVGHALLAPDLGGGARLLPLAHVVGAALGLVLQAWAHHVRCRRRSSHAAMRGSALALGFVGGAGRSGAGRL